MSSDPILLMLPVPPLVKYYIDTENAKPIKQRAYCTSHHYRKKIEKQLEEIL